MPLPIKIGYLFGYRHGPKHSSEIALTFDDSPCAHTNKLLKMLRNYHIQATFFLIGKNVERLPEVAKAILAEGHEIGNHSHSHTELNWRHRLGHPFPEEEIVQSQRTIKRVLGVETKLFRPTKSLALHRGYRAFIKKHNLIPILSSSYSRARRPAEKQLRDVTRKLKGGDIILLHDGADIDINSNKWSQKTLQILPELIKCAREKNLQFVTVSKLLNL